MHSWYSSVWVIVAIDIIHLHAFHPQNTPFTVVKLSIFQTWNVNVRGWKGLEMTKKTYYVQTFSYFMFEFFNSSQIIQPIFFSEMNILFECLNGVSW